MNRLDRLFSNKKNDILSVFLTAGFPRIDSTADIIEELASQGADMVEIGVPFSDPMADGTVIQHSSAVALKNGMNLSLLLEQAEKTNKRVPDMPFVLMSYLNPLYHYGMERLLADCRDAGIDAIIIPDLPFSEYMREYRPLCKKYGIHMIMLITPETSIERIHLIDDNCSGFIYMVSAASTTGSRHSFTPEQTGYFRKIADMGLKNPRLIGFGISNRSTYADACANSSGGIIGSMFIKCLESTPSIREAVAELMKRLGQE